MRIATRPLLGTCCLLLVLAPLATAATPSAPQAAEKSYAVKLSTERAGAVYETGEEVKFIVRVTCGDELVDNGEVSYVLDDEGPNQLGSGSVALAGKPAVISGRMAKPGFLRCRVTFKPADGKPAGAVAGAAISPEEIEPSLPVPDDFDAYWSDQKEQLARVPMKADLTPVESPGGEIECFDVEIECLGGAPVSGYFGRPKGAEPKSLPAILWVHGAGVRSSSLGNAITGANLGMLSMDINAHGIPNGKPGQYYSDLARGELANYPHRGRESRDTCYFRGMYLRLARAIDFLASQPEWDGEVLAVVGHSQGGGQALVAGGLDDRVSFVATGVPAICDHTGMAIGRINGWPKLVPNGPDGKPDPGILEASRYVDAVNFASRSKADAIMSVGFIDSVCPPTTCYAAYNRLQGKKQILHEPFMGHAAPGHIQEAFLKAIRAHVEQHAAETANR